MTRPAATLVMPLRRQVDEWLDQSVRSAVAQTVPCEIVVVTSEWTPRSNLAILERHREQHPNLVIRQREPGKGFVWALNFGFRAATADRLGILLTDDWLEPTAVEECLDRDADIVSTGFKLFMEDGQRLLLERSVSRADFEAQTTLERKAAYLCYFFLFSREKLLQIGGADESIGADSPGLDDYDMIWVLLERGASVAVTDRSLYNVRDHPGERLTTRDPRAMTATMDRILAKHGLQGEEKQRLLAQHARWFGRPMFEILREEARADG